MSADETDDSLAAMLENLAKGIVRDVEKEGIDRRIDAMKACGAWYLGQARINGKVPDEAPQDTGLPAFRKRVEEASQGGK